MTREQVSKVPSGRVRRTPVGVRNRLSVPNQDPNFHYRIVNIVDVDGNPTSKYDDRIAQGYEVVEGVKVGDKRVDIPSSLGSAAEISVGRGARAVVMRIPKEYYEEDQKYKQDKIDELESSMSVDAKTRKTAT